MTVASPSSGRWLAGALVVALALALADVLIGGRAFRILLLVVVAIGAVLAVMLLARYRRAELDVEQAGVLAEMGALLESSLDYQATLRNVARITVPRVADWCVLDMVDGDGALARLAVAHSEPEKEAIAWELAARQRSGPDDTLAAARVLRTGEPELLHDVAEATEDPDDQRLLRSLGLSSAVAVPLRGRDKSLGVLTAVSADPARRYGSADVKFFEHLAERAALAIDNARLYRAAREAERTSEEGLALLDTLFERAPVGLGYFDGDLRYVRVNQALAAMDGVPAESHLGKAVAEVLPGMDPGLLDVLRQVMSTGEPVVDRELTGETPAAPGRRRSWVTSCYPVRDYTGQTIGLGVSVVEITDRKAAAEALRRQTEVYEALLRAQSDVGECVLITDQDRILYANAACEQVTGYALDELTAMPSMFEIVPLEEREALRDRVSRLVDSEDIEPAYETSILHKDGQRVDLELAAKPLRMNGQAQLVLVARDITERRRAEQERARLLVAEREAREAAEDARRRATFLAEASALLDAALDLEHAFKSLTRLCVPYLGDICCLDMVTGPGDIARVAVAAADSEQEAVLVELFNRFPIDPLGEHPVARTIRHGRVEPLPEMGDGVYEDFAADSEHMELLRRLAFKRALVVPLRARGRTLGAFTLGRTDPGPPYGPDEVQLLEDLARRAALAIDNARLYEERSHVAHTLQSSLLPAELPKIAGVEAAARYRAAGEAYEVGGDFYDLFETRGGRWAVLVGDVCGKGAEAAAITALARYTLRAGAMQVDSPSRALALLNEALLRHGGEGEFCTVVHAALQPGGGSAELTLASGGHPLPLILRADGRVENAGEPGTVLGVVPDPRLTDTAIELGAGEALVLYTDGVTEARLPDGSLLGREGLADLVAECGGLDAATIAERIEAAAVQLEGGEPRDDIAVVVLRIA